MFLGLQLIQDQSLEVCRLVRCSKLPLIELLSQVSGLVGASIGRIQSYLDVAKEVTLHWCEGLGTEDILAEHIDVSFNCPIGPMRQVNIPNRVVKASAASRNSVVAIALSLATSTGTSANDFFMESNQVPPGGTIAADDILEASSRRAMV